MNVVELLMGDVALRVIARCLMVFGAFSCVGGSIGAAEKSRVVFDFESGGLEGWRVVEDNFLVGAISTIWPRYMTAT